MNQLPPVFTRAEWATYWKKTRHSNEKLKNRIGGSPLPCPASSVAKK